MTNANTLLCPDTELDKFMARTDYKMYKLHVQPEATLDEVAKTKVAYAHFTLREWKIITEALTTRRQAAGYYAIEGQGVSKSDIDEVLTKCPSTAL